MQLPLDTDILSTNRNAMVGLGMALQALLGAGPNVDGLPCTPGTGLSVNIGPGSIYVSAPIDQTAYGSLPADTTDQIVQQGITFGQTPLSVPAPTTAGQSINYLIEAQFQQVDSQPVQLLYYNSANPLQPLQGTATNTKRGGVCALQVKAGTSAATGSQTTPAPDAGWTGLYVVTVPYGATSITQGEISLCPGAPFIGTKLGGFMRAYAGNPNGNLAGNAGVPGLSVPSLVWDTTDAALWVCTTTGSASTAVWLRISGPLSGLGIGAGLYNDGNGNLAASVGLIYINSNAAVGAGDYLVDTSAGSLTLALPPNTSKGVAITFIDAMGTWANTNWTLAHNGNTIMGQLADLVVDMSDQQFSIWYNGSDWRLV